MNFEEKLETLQPVLSLNLDNDELIKQIDERVREAQKLYDEKIDKKGKKNLDYWMGNHPVKKGESEIVENIIFRNVETIIPILTANTPTPRVFHPNLDFNDKLTKLLNLRWGVYDKMLGKSRRVLRHGFIYYLGVMKVRYDPDEDEIIWEVVHPKKVLIDPKATSLYDCQWVAQLVGDMTVQEVMDKYLKGKRGDKKDKFLKEVGIRKFDKNALGTKISFIEFSTPEWTVWKYKSVVLHKQKNPNWDWQDGFNILKKPLVPYIFFDIFEGVKDDEGVYGNTSLIEQAIPLQDLVNKRKRQIDENADEANGSLVASGDYIDRDKFSQITGKPRERIWIERGDPRLAIYRVAGNPLQAYVFNDFIQTKAEIDNIMGSHSTTRGEGRQGQATATERIIERQQDYGRIDDIVKSFEDFSEDYFLQTLQMMIVHFNDSHLYPLENEDSVEISRDVLIKELSKIPKLRRTELEGERYETDIKFTKPTVVVKKGSTLPTDDVTRRQTALELAKAGVIDPLSLNEDLKASNPDERVRRLIVWQKDPTILFPELRQLEQGQEEYPQSMIDDTKAILEGQVVEPNPAIQKPEEAASHIQGHSRYMDSDEFKKLSPDIQQNYLDHVKQEVDIIKQNQL